MDEANRVDEPGDEDAGVWGDAVTPTAGNPARPGDIVVDPGVARLPAPIVGKDESTPLEEDEPEGVVPPCPLWAMKERRHVQWHLLPSHKRHERVRDGLGAGDEAVYVIDDGDRHVMLGRRVGAHADECEYCLIGRTTRQRYEDLRAGTVPLADAFADATELTLCGVAVAESVLSSNVFDVSRFESPADIPVEYWPGAPFLAFDEDLEITVD